VCVRETRRAISWPAQVERAPEAHVMSSIDLSMLSQTSNDNCSELTTRSKRMWLSTYRVYVPINDDSLGFDTLTNSANDGE